MSSAPEKSALAARIPIRWRLAGTSALLTLLILLASSLVVGSLLTDRIQSDFKRNTRDAARTLAADTVVSVSPSGYQIAGTSINDFAASQQARIRVLDLSGNVIAQTPGAPDLGLVLPGESQIAGFSVVTQVVPVQPSGHAVIQYARSIGELDHTIDRVRLLLAFGVIGGALLALAAGLALARRAMQPIDALTKTAQGIERSGDPGQSVPIPPADDEVRKLAETFAAMRASLETAKVRTEAALDRQRQFAADASHELRTPLTAVIANLDMVADDLDAESRESVEAARRSAKRMNALVSDLLMLARTDSHTTEYVRVDLKAVVEDVRNVLEPLLEDRAISVTLSDCSVNGDPDQLAQAVRNLVGNAIGHTPSDAHIDVVLSSNGSNAVLVVADNGPGVAEEIRPTVFERFVRSGGDAGGSSGLGLAIVRAVCDAHGGEVRLESLAPHGARFTVTLPLSQD